MTDGRGQLRLHLPTALWIQEKEVMPARLVGNFHGAEWGL